LWFRQAEAIPTNWYFVLLDDAAGRDFLSEWPLKPLAFLTTSKLLVAGSIPAGVANLSIYKLASNLS